MVRRGTGFLGTSMVRLPVGGTFGFAKMVRGFLGAIGAGVLPNAGVPPVLGRAVGGGVFWYVFVRDLVSQNAFTEEGFCDTFETV